MSPPAQKAVPVPVRTNAPTFVSCAAQANAPAKTPALTNPLNVSQPNGREDVDSHPDCHAAPSPTQPTLRQAVSLTASSGVVSTSHAITTSEKHTTPSPTANPACVSGAPSSAAATTTFHTKNRVPAVIVASYSPSNLNPMSDHVAHAAPAHAKLNLALAVGPPDEQTGYHPIASLFTAIDLHDTVSVRALHDDAAPSQYAIAWDDGADTEWPSADDLAVKAHRAIEAEIGRPIPIELSVAKRIPAGGGLGGGSSDAATTLRLLDQTLGLHMDDTTLHRIAHKLGSDIPFFLDTDRTPAEPPRPAIVTGFGEHVQRIEPEWLRSGVGFVLVCPPFGCPTASVYRAFDDGPINPDLRHAQIESIAAATVIDPDQLFNDLAAPAAAIEPRIADLLDTLKRSTRARFHVSGSGSTLFAIGDDALRDSAASAVPDCRTLLARPI